MIGKALGHCLIGYADVEISAEWATRLVGAIGQRREGEMEAAYWLAHTLWSWLPVKDRKGGDGSAWNARKSSTTGSKTAEMEDSPRCASLSGLIRSTTGMAVDGSIGPIR